MTPAAGNWKSVLFVPAHLDHMVAKAHLRKADAIQLDLEDGVPLAQKQAAGDALPGAIKTLSDLGVDVIVRINRDLENCIHDLDRAVCPGTKAISLPKTLGPDHVVLIDEHISALERSRGLEAGGIRLIAMIETIDALNRVEAIARAGSRLSALAIGCEDLSAECAVQPTADFLTLPCQKLALAARGAGLRAYGFPGSISDIADLDGFRRSAEKGRVLGFQGAFCIHPNQVEILNGVFTPSVEERRMAERILKAYDTACNQGLGAVELDGRMVDLPVVENARQLLAMF